MLSDLNRVIEQLSKEKGIDRNVIVEAVEQAMLSAQLRRRSRLSRPSWRPPRLPPLRAPPQFPWPPQLGHRYHSYSYGHRYCAVWSNYGRHCVTWH